MTNVIRVDLPFLGTTADGDNNVNRVWWCMQEIDAQTQVSLHSFFPFLVIELKAFKFSQFSTEYASEFVSVQSCVYIFYGHRVHLQSKTKEEVSNFIKHVKFTLRTMYDAKAYLRMQLYLYWRKTNNSKERESFFHVLSVAEDIKSIAKKIYKGTFPDAAFKCYSVSQDVSLQRFSPYQIQCTYNPHMLEFEINVL